MYEHYFEILIYRLLFKVLELQDSFCSQGE